MAMGARGGDVVRMVMRQALALTAVGIAIGLVAALSLTGVIENMLFGVSSRDPVTIAGVVGLLAGIALLSTLALESCTAPARAETASRSSIIPSAHAARARTSTSSSSSAFASAAMAWLRSIRPSPRAAYSRATGELVVRAPTSGW